MTRVRRALVEALWDGDIPAELLGSESLTELRLVSVICDRKLRPQKIYLLRLPLSGGEFLKLAREKAGLLRMDMDMLKRPVNVGFSGGEKKRA